MLKKVKGNSQNGKEMITQERLEFPIGKEKVKCVKTHIMHSVQHDDTDKAGRIRMEKEMPWEK